MEAVKGRMKQSSNLYSASQLRYKKDCTRAPNRRQTSQIFRCKWLLSGVILSSLFCSNHGSSLSLCSVSRDASVDSIFTSFLTSKSVAKRLSQPDKFSYMQIRIICFLINFMQKPSEMSVLVEVFIYCLPLYVFRGPNICISHRRNESDSFLLI